MGALVRGVEFFVFEVVFVVGLCYRGDVVIDLELVGRKVFIW